jgi:hypothetical protein
VPDNVRLIQQNLQPESPFPQIGLRFAIKALQEIEAVEGEGVSHAIALRALQVLRVEDKEGYIVGTNMKVDAEGRPSILDSPLTEDDAPDD